MTESPMADRRAEPDRFLIGIVIGAVLLILAGVALVFVGGRPSRAAPVDPDSPVGVVQRYVEALESGDEDVASSYLTRSARAAEKSDRERFPSPVQRSGLERRLLIEPIRVTGDTAEVNVTVSTFRANVDPFSTSTYHQDVTVRLIREEGIWRISQPIDRYLLMS